LLNYALVADISLNAVPFIAVVPAKAGTQCREGGR